MDALVIAAVVAGMAAAFLLGAWTQLTWMNRQLRELLERLGK